MRYLGFGDRKIEEVFSDLDKYVKMAMNKHGLLFFFTCFLPLVVLIAIQLPLILMDSLTPFRTKNLPIKATYCESYEGMTTRVGSIKATKENEENFLQITNGQGAETRYKCLVGFKIGKTLFSAGIDSTTLYKPGDVMKVKYLINEDGGIHAYSLNNKTVDYFNFDN